jgi:hypothetical protein
VVRKSTQPSKKYTSLKTSGVSTSSTRRGSQLAHRSSLIQQKPGGMAGFIDQYEVLRKDAEKSLEREQLTRLNHHKGRSVKNSPPRKRTLLKSSLTNDH